LNCIEISTQSFMVTRCDCSQRILHIVSSPCSNQLLNYLTKSKVLRLYSFDEQRFLIKPLSVTCCSGCFYCKTCSVHIVLDNDLLGAGNQFYLKIAKFELKDDALYEVEKYNQSNFDSFISLKRKCCFSKHQFVSNLDSFLDVVTEPVFQSYYLTTTLLKNPFVFSFKNFSSLYSVDSLTIWFFLLLLNYGPHPSVFLLKYLKGLGFIDHLVFGKIKWTPKNNWTAQFDFSFFNCFNLFSTFSFRELWVSKAPIVFKSYVNGEMVYFETKYNNYHKSKTMDDIKVFKFNLLNNFCVYCKFDCQCPSGKFFPEGVRTKLNYYLRNVPIHQLKSFSHHFKTAFLCLHSSFLKFEKKPLNNPYDLTNEALDLIKSGELSRMNLTHAHFKMDDYHIRSPAFVTPYLDDYSLSTRDFFKNRSVFLEIEEGMEDDLVSTSSFANLLLEKSNMVKLHLSELVLADKEAKSYNEKYPWEIPIPFLGPKPIKSNFVIGSFEDYEERVRLERLELLRVKSANDQYNAKRDLINKAKERERIMAGSRGNYPLPFF